MRTFHREAHDWGFRDYYFQFNATIEFVARTGVYVAQIPGRVSEFSSIWDARRFVKGAK